MADDPAEIQFTNLQSICNLQFAICNAQ